MKVKLTECPICEGTEFKDLDYMRNANYWYEKDHIFEDYLGFKVCKKCGFLTYDYVPEEELVERYSRERVLVHPAVIETGNRKNAYHHHFLKDVIKPNWDIIDIGCAAGLFLDYCHKAHDVPSLRLWGTEYCRPFAAFAKHEYGINIIDEVNDMTPLKWDLIALYHVFEHMQNPLKTLKMLRSHLNRGGLMYISIPVYLDTLEDTAGPITDNFEGYLHLNHVNLFTRNSFLNCLAKAGLKVIKEDTAMYGLTVLLEPCNPVTDIVYEDAELVEWSLLLQKAAIEGLYKNVDESIRLWPKYPDAYIYKSLSEGRIKTFKEQMESLKVGIDCMPDNQRLIYQFASVLYQWDENTPDKEKRFWFSNNVRLSEKMMLDSIKIKPGNDDAYLKLAKINIKYKRDWEAAAKYLDMVYEISPNKWAELVSIRGWMWNERGL